MLNLWYGMLRNRTPHCQQNTCLCTQTNQQQQRQQPVARPPTGVVCCLSVCWHACLRCAVDCVTNKVKSFPRHNSATPDGCRPALCYWRRFPLLLLLLPAAAAAFCWMALDGLHHTVRIRLLPSQGQRLRRWRLWCERPTQTFHKRQESQRHALDLCLMQRLEAQSPPLCVSRRQARKQARGFQLRVAPLSLDRT